MTDTALSIAFAGLARGFRNVVPPRLRGRLAFLDLAMDADAAVASPRR
jgi:hypothetical protein